jgi:hypothetical protein
MKDFWQMIWQERVDKIVMVTQLVEEEMRAVTIKALEKFWSITQMPMDEDNKTIVARSIAYIGHILTKRESLVRSEEQTFELNEAKEPNKIFQPFQISGDLSLFLSNEHQLCCLYLHYECSLRPLFVGGVLYPDIYVFHHHFCHTVLLIAS